jgi:hypothetical protein
LQSDPLLPLATTQHSDQETSLPLRTFLKEQQSTTSNFVLVTVAKSLAQQATPASLKHELAIRCVSACHLEAFVNFQPTAEQPLVCSQVTAETKCLCELQVQHTTRPRPVVSCSHT